MSQPDKTIAIIQARINSTRLPRKIFADIGGQPMLWQVVNRARQARFIDEVVVATTTSADDDAVVDYCEKAQIVVHRGSEEDVLDRFYRTAESRKASLIVRLTADCPFTDPAIIDQTIEAFHACPGCEYATNVLRYTFPEGLDVEVFSFAALERSWKEATKSADREHVTLHMHYSGRFLTAPNVEHVPDLSARNFVWSVDNEIGLRFARVVFDELGDRDFRLDDILRLLEQKPEILHMNQETVINEGLYRDLAKEPPVPVQKRKLDASHALLKRAAQAIPTRSQTFSKAPTQFVQGVAPNFIARGKGCHVWDVDGNEYIDYAMALAPVVLGHGDPDVTAAVTAEIQHGTAFSLPHPLEVEVAEMLIEMIPCAEMVRFGKNGSDATAGAIRVARAFTKRDVVAMCGYHGWQDWCIAPTTRNKGIPQAVCDLTKTFAYNDIASLEKIFAENEGQVAAVILEATGIVAPKPGFLEAVKECAHKHGAILIFDEIVTGFRWANGGAQEFFGVIPDLGCFGKAMGNGFPIAAVVGRRDIMEWMDEVFFSFTFGGETAALAAAKAVLTKFKQQPVIEHIWNQGKRIQDAYNVLAKTYGIEKFTECIGYAPRSVSVFRDETGAESLLYKSLFQQECLKRGILFTGGHNLSLSHEATDISLTLRVYRTAMEILANAIRAGDAADRLEGPPVQPVFRKA